MTRPPCLSTRSRASRLPALPHPPVYSMTSSEATKLRTYRAVGVGVLSPLSYIFVLAALGVGALLSVVAPALEI